MSMFAFLKLAPREWVASVKVTIGRFVRGNIAAQNEHILLPSEQEAESARSRTISKKWKARYQRA
jgi:hypothetical protein